VPNSAPQLGLGGHRPEPGHDRPGDPLRHGQSAALAKGRRHGPAVRRRVLRRGRMPVRRDVLRVEVARVRRGATSAAPKGLLPVHRVAPHRDEFADVVARLVAGMILDNPPRFFERTPYGYHVRRSVVDDVTVAGFASPPTFECRSYTSRDGAGRGEGTLRRDASSVRDRTASSRRSRRGRGRRHRGGRTTNRSARPRRTDQRAVRQSGEVAGLSRCAPARRRPSRAGRARPLRSTDGGCRPASS
jgi:hypothetical protein